MCTLFGFTGWVVTGLLYLAGVATLPALKAGFAKAKAWWQQHVS